LRVFRVADRYIFRQLLLGVIFSVSGLTLIAIPGMVVAAVNRFGGTRMIAVLGFIPFELAGLLPLLLPISFLLAVVATYGRLAADNEWTALCTAGISPYRLFVPALVLAVAISGLNHWLVSFEGPGLRYAKRAYARHQVVEQLQHTSFMRTRIDLAGFHLEARAVVPEERRFLDVLIYLPGDRSDESGQTLLADELTLEIDEPDLVVTLKGARRIHSENISELENLKLRRNIDALFGIREEDRSKWRHQTTPDLGRMLARGEVREHEERGARFEFHYRYATAATALTFLLLGAPTGLLLRRGSRLLAMVVAVAFTLAYQLLSGDVGKAFALSGQVPVWFGAWFPTLLTVAVSPFLFYRAVRR